MFGKDKTLADLQKSAPEESLDRKKLSWWAKGIWLMMILLFARGAMSTVNDATKLLPQSKNVIVAVSEIAKFPSQNALTWGLQCARMGLTLFPGDSIFMAQRSDLLFKCLTPDTQSDIMSAAYDPADAVGSDNIAPDPPPTDPLAATNKSAGAAQPAPKPFGPLKVEAIEPVNIAPSDAHHAVAVYLAYITGGRQRYYSVGIYAENAHKFLMEGIPHPSPAPAEFADAPTVPDSNAALVSALQPRLDNFFAAYLTANADALSGLTVRGKIFKSPPNDFPAGQTPYRGLANITARPLGGDQYVAVVSVRMKDAVSKIISSFPYRVVLSKVSVGPSDNEGRYLVESLSDTPTS